MKTGNSVLYFAAAASVCLFFLTSCATEKPSGKKNIQVEEKANLSAAAKLAAHYFAVNQRSDGSFNYINHPAVKNGNSKYNILRHAGAIYALSTYAESFPAENFLITINNSVRYMQKNIKPIDSEKYALFSHRSESRKYGSTQAKLGGAGLALVALVTAEKINPKLTSDKVLHGLAEFIIYMQNEDGSFCSKYIRGVGKDRSFISLYYPGEAMLGLMLMYERESTERWFKSALQGMLYLAESRKRSGKYLPDHWALIATEKIIKSWPAKGSYSENDKKKILEHASCVAKVLKKDQIMDSSRKKLYGSYLVDGRVCPAATRLEGLIAFVKTPGISEEMKQEVLKSCRAGIRFILQAQLKNGDFAGGFVRAVMKKQSAEGRKKAFNFRAQEIRIDYVQHALSAIIGYYRLQQTR